MKVHLLDGPMGILMIYDMTIERTNICIQFISDKLCGF